MYDYYNANTLLLLSCSAVRVQGITVKTKVDMKNVEGKQEIMNIAHSYDTSCALFSWMYKRLFGTILLKSLGDHKVNTSPGLHIQVPLDLHEI